ncbi:MAG: ABC transporter permease [Proteobacteria bacterium]|nr:ABC transporter permease [Pseudomonadota bacterium]MCP4921920.1 ABC transporter permease [Pseudomonadota bacterium]
MFAHMLRRALRSLRENLFLNLVSTGVVAAAVLLAGVYLAVMVNMTRVVDSWDRDVHVSAYFFTDVPVDRRFEVKDDVAARPEVAEIRYVTEEEAADWLVDRVEDVGPIVAELGPEVLPASLEITLHGQHTRPGDIAVFVESIESPDFEFVDYGQEWVQRFNTFLALLQVVGLVLGSLIMLAAVFLVGNTMHLVAYARRQELETMKLVGSTWSFVAIPFMIEGAIQGLVGGTIALLAVFGLYIALVTQLESALTLALGDEGLAFLPIEYTFALLSAGVFLGVVGCLFSIHRFWRQAP